VATGGLTSNLRQNKWCIIEINGGEGEANLGEELHREIRERGSLEPWIGGGWERERAKRQQRKKKEAEGLRLNRYRDKGTSLIGALLCYNGANEADALPVDVACSSV
jgi:hypothetical protein